jgi:hypothetical protein
VDEPTGAFLVGWIRSLAQLLYKSFIILFDPLSTDTALIFINTLTFSRRTPETFGCDCFFALATILNCKSQSRRNDRDG